MEMTFNGETFFNRLLFSMTLDHIYTMPFNHEKEENRKFKKCFSLDLLAKKSFEKMKAKIKILILFSLVKMVMKPASASLTSVKALLLSI